MSKVKKIIFIRHGKTEMNEYLDQIEWGGPDFVDPELWDSGLTTNGIHQASKANSGLKDSLGVHVDLGSIELLVSSPLKRALQTSELVFHENLPNAARVAHPLFRERVYMSSEIGRQKHVLENEHPNWNYDHLPDNANWWYEHTTDEERAAYVEWRVFKDGVYCCPGEPDEVFRARIMEARAWLLERPEECIAVVTHWGMLKGLTGISFENCEIKVLSSEDLLVKPDIIDY